MPRILPFRSPQPRLIRALVLAAICGLFASCASTPTTTLAPRYTRSYDRSLDADPAARKAWSAYCDRLERDMRDFYRNEPDGVYKLSFETEYKARDGMLDVYLRALPTGRSPGKAYLDELAAIRASGYLRAYVYFELNPGYWPKPSDLEAEGYLAWMKANHPAHLPRTLEIVSKVAGESAAGQSPVGLREVDMPQWSRMERLTVELSFITLAGFWYTDSVQTAQAVTDLMAGMLPRQEIVWGPAVHQPDANIAGKPIFTSDALAFISRDIDSGEYYVVFRGTNPISADEWYSQDFLVQDQVPWLELSPGPAPEDAKVSDGTARAVTMRKELRPEPGFAGEDITLAEALIAILEDSPGPCVMHFTGHSLGGLLAPTMALWLVDKLDESERGDLAAKLQFDVYAYAGPTAGNEAFAAYCESRIPRCARYTNDLDIAPRAWSEETMLPLPSLYEPLIEMDAVTKSLYDISLDLSRGKGYTQPFERVAVPGKIVVARGDIYLLEAAYQHSIPYLDILLPERKENILREVLEPLTSFVTINGVKPIDIMSLFEEVQ